MSTAPVNGITVGYDDEGSGAPLVFIHGHPFDRTMWAPQISEFTGSGWRMIAPDLRGYGESSVVPGTVAWKTFALDIAALLDHLLVDDVVLGGLSMGADRDGVLPTVPRPGPRPATRRHLLPGRDRRRQEGTQRPGRPAARRGHARLRRGGAAKMVTPYNIKALPAVAEHVLAMMLRTSPSGAAAALRSRAEHPDYTDLLGQTSVPTLVVVGRDDEFTPVAAAEFMAKLIPLATLAVIDGAAHLPNLERQAEFNQALHRFLAQRC